MASIKNPVLFSHYFNLDPNFMVQHGVIDPFLNIDTPLFVDPLLLEKSSILDQSASNNFKKYFSDVVRLIIISERRGDKAWRSAEQILSLAEVPETGLGYGGSSRSGQSRPKELREDVLKTMKEIVRLGSKDPEMISLMGLFETGVGADTISDLTTKAILPDLCKLTEQICEELDIEKKSYNDFFGATLPRNVFRKTDEPIIFVPLDVVRDLPLATDWNGVGKVIDENRALRERVNRQLGILAKRTVEERKIATRKAAMSSKEAFEAFLMGLKDAVKSYDIKGDPTNQLALRKLLTEGEDLVPGPLELKGLTPEEQLKKVVEESIDHFKHHIENGNLWELCWDGAVYKKERAWQLVFFAIAEIFCKISDTDISPEAAMGGGPVDFKFSKGFNLRAVVELKLSTGSVDHGYKKQLEVYKDASRTDIGYFVVIMVKNNLAKVNQIRTYRDSRDRAGEQTSPIYVVEGRPRPSASKR